MVGASGRPEGDAHRRHPSRDAGLHQPAHQAFIPGEAESKVIDGRRPCRSRFELKANSDHLHRVGRGGGNGSRGAGTREAAKRDELRLLIVGLDTQHQIRSEPM